MSWRKMLSDPGSLKYLRWAADKFVPGEAKSLAEGVLKVIDAKGSIEALLKEVG